MRRALALAVLALALVACTKVGPPPPDFYSTLEAIRVEMTAVGPAPLALATATLAPTPEPTATPAPTATALPPDTPTPSAPEAGSPAANETPAAAIDVAPTATPVLYVVQRGDYLTYIADQYGVSVEALIDANEIADANVIEVGQVLVIPTAEPVP